MTIKNFIESFRPNYDLLSYVVARGVGSWYCIPIDYWLMNQWSQIGISNDLSDEDKAAVFLTKVEPYRLSNSFVRKAYERIKEQSNDYQKRFFIPMVYCDFDHKLLYTIYGEVALEDSLLPGWEGKLLDFRQLIREADSYWSD
ncbi:hypothetical protein [Yoonia sp.]|uniref:hypothetical protein n=1 Tax=Yoonia sp. TaxID=2212373 RepID=UPI0025DA7D7C|nr:hypothetical protein [Yoonia sp.]